MNQTDISVSQTSGKPHETCLHAKFVGKKSRERGGEWKAEMGEMRRREGREFENVLRYGKI